MGARVVLYIGVGKGVLFRGALNSGVLSYRASCTYIRNRRFTVCV